MVNSTNGTGGRLINRRIDPTRDKRRLALFFGGLIVFYIGVLLISQPELNGGEAELAKIAFGVMLAPTVGAVLACVNGFNGGIPAFSVGLVGFVLFVGVLTERSRSVWPSVLAHGSWNALVQSYFSSSGAEADRVFTGSRYLLGEFGWLGAAGMLILGIAFAWWHFRTPTTDDLSPKQPTGYQSPLMWLWFRNTPKLKTTATAT